MTFHANRGDVFLWHGALIHGGSRARDTTMTRRSLVLHYSSVSAYGQDRRFPGIEPQVYRREGGCMYLKPSGSTLFFARARRRIAKLLRS